MLSIYGSNNNISRNKDIGYLAKIEIKDYYALTEKIKFFCPASEVYGRIYKRRLAARKKHLRRISSSNYAIIN